MKTLKLIVPALYLFVFIYAAIAQEKTTSNTAVVDKFNELFPEAVVKKWDNKKDHKIQVQFVDNEQEKRAYFAANGTWLYMERDIELTNIPVEIIQEFNNSQWATWKIEKAEEVISPDHPVLFILKVRREDYKMYLHYRPDGTLLNASSKVIF